MKLDITKALQFVDANAVQAFEPAVNDANKALEEEDTILSLVQSRHRQSVRNSQGRIPRDFNDDDGDDEDE